ncbi:MAG: DsbA family protein [Phycisphaerales bacterium]|nr:MAG: DsbA family protein [Phycisphaerales bacterium]
MTWMTRMMLAAVMCGLLLGNVAVAQDREATGSDDPDIQEINAELQEIRRELAAVRGELKTVLAELRAMKASQAKPPQRQPRQPDTTVYNIAIGDSPIRGPKDAKVTIVEYVSFACGWCIREVPTLKKVLEANPKDVRWVFKSYPMWPRAHAAHAAAALALEQKGNEGFWQMHDMIMEGGAKKLNTPDLRGYAEKLNMDLEKFDAVMADSAKVEALAAKDVADAKKYRVTGTPAIFINGRRLSGKRTVENYQAQIDAALKPGGLLKPTPAGAKKDLAPAKK